MMIQKSSLSHDDKNSDNESRMSLFNADKLFSKFSRNPLKIAFHFH